MKYSYENIDERIVKTRFTLSWAILNLIEKNKNTKVLDICHEAKITPMTYYHHFHNKKQLLIYAIKQELQGILPIPKKLKPINIKHLIYYLITSLNVFIQQKRTLIWSMIQQKKIGSNYYSYIDLIFEIIQDLIKEELRILIHCNESYANLMSITLGGCLKNLFTCLVVNQQNISNKNLWLSFKSMFMEFNGNN